MHDGIAPIRLSRIGREIRSRTKGQAAMERAVAAKRFRPDVPFHMTNQWWIVVHGYVLAEVAGYQQSPASEAVVLWPALQRLFVGMGDDNERVHASMKPITDNTGSTD